ncbi:MAG TPA: HEAT repeat domain-containing protein [Bryobacteraceae bacterium]|nr:HEAT repeat domain-containing protein [Bryobacteraceae bacterium]
MLPVLSQTEADITACFAQDIAALVESFSEKETSGKQSLQQMLSSDPAAFSRASIQVLAQANGAAGARYVLHLLRKFNLLMEALVDPRASKREVAIAAARMIPRIGAPIDGDLERLLSTTLAEPPFPENVARVLRLLDVLEATSLQPRFVLYQTELLRYRDTEVRSRAALLIARSSRSVSLVSRLLLDEDERVQANVVEALWAFDRAEARPLLLQAMRSKTGRVAANAAVGLYRVGDLSSIGLLLGMAREKDAGRRTSAAWAMGETGDPRFLPFLTAWFANSSGNERVNILQALGRIRRGEKALAEAGSIEIRSWDVKVTNGERRVVLSLHSGETPDLSALKPTHFTICEGGTLVEDYDISAQPNSPLAISGFVLPRFSSIADPYRIALLDAMERCLKYKRADDVWRIDRYLIEPRTGELDLPLEKAALPYDEALLGSLGRTHQRGFLAVPEALRKIIENPGPKQRAADDAIAAFDRQSEAMIKFSGKRKLFLFLPHDSGSRLERHLARLRSFIENERLSLHAIAPQGSAGNEEFRSLCLASEGGSFASLAPEQVADEIERIYAQSINRFEITYRVPRPAEPSHGTIQITSGSGCGRATFLF